MEKLSRSSLSCKIERTGLANYVEALRVTFYGIYPPPTLAAVLNANKSVLQQHRVWQITLM